jgi:3-hydroxyacyl-[acyl-carrier-protein] dehydratase
MDRAAIEAVIPHRAPFLFVDRVMERGASSITTEWDVAAELPAFRGHYPGEPLLPGVLSAEFAFQSGALLLMGEPDAESRAGAVPALAKIENARFRRMVRPGETLRAHVEMVERVGPARYLKATVTSGGASVLQVRFTVTLADAGKES